MAPWRSDSLHLPLFENLIFNHKKLFAINPKNEELDISNDSHLTKYLQHASNSSSANTERMRYF